jgi:hypothetical protein
MKNQMTSRLLTLGLLLVSLTNCKEKDEVTPEPPVVAVVDWKQSENFTVGMFNSKIIEDKLYAISADEFYYDVDINSATQTQSFRQYLTRVGRYKLPVSNKIVVTRTENEIFIFPSNDIKVENAARLKLIDLDPDFKVFEDIPLWQGEAFGITNSGAVLIPYRVQVNGIGIDSPYFVLIKTEIENGKVVIKDTKIIQENLIFYYDNCYRLQSFDNFFLAQVGINTFKIADNGTVEKMSEYDARAIKTNNEITSIEVDRNTGDIYIRRGDLNGNNWRLIGKYPFIQTLNQAEYAFIDNKIVAYLGNNLYHVIIEGNNLKLVELENSKLEGGRITSITQLAGQNIMVTTSCDGPIRNCGVFTKSLSDFFKPKNLNK